MFVTVDYFFVRKGNRSLSEKRAVWSQFHKVLHYTHGCKCPDCDGIHQSPQLKLGPCFGARHSESFSYVSRAFKALRFIKNMDQNFPRWMLSRISWQYTKLIYKTTINTSLDITAEIISPFTHIHLVFSVRTFYPSSSILIMKIILEITLRLAFPNASYSSSQPSDNEEEVLFWAFSQLLEHPHNRHMCKWLKKWWKHLIWSASCS